MPGLTIVATAGPPPAAHARDAAALAAFEHFPDYVTETLVDLPRLRVSATRHPGYPIARVGAGRFAAVLEGRVYDASGATVAAELLDLCGRVFAGDAADAALARFAAHDGEFVAALVDRDAQAAVVVADRHGRLPLYRSRRDGRDVVSRELGFAARAHGTPRLAPQGMAEFLAFGYPLGAGTFYQDVVRLEPASVVRMPGGEAERSHAPHDFDDRDDGADADGLADGIAAGLVAACRTRAAGRLPVLVSLSGGIDSRMVAGALRRAGVAARAVTHAGTSSRAAREAAVASRVAAALAMPWDLHAVAPPTGADVGRLLAMKGGANYVGMSRVLPYLDALRAAHGAAAVLFTGDLGDRLLGDRRPGTRLRDVDDLAEYLLRREAVLSPELVARMTGVPRAALHGAVAARLAAYPERTLERKHVHFLFYERALRWVYEGEDRNRCFLWHATPFYAPAVFAAAARAPDELKADDRLRRAVLRRVAPEVADVENAGTGAAVAAPGATWRRRARVAGTSLLFRTVGEPTERRLRRWLSPADGHGDESAVLRLIRAQLRRGGPVSDYLHPAAVESVLTQARDYEREQFSVVLTMTSVIDALQEGEPALGGFRDVPMT